MLYGNKQKNRFLTTTRLVKKYKLLYLMMLPGIIYFIIFRYIPIYGITLAFKDYKIALGIMGSPWIGFDNFTALFAGRTFLNVLRNTVILSLYRMLWGFPAPILLALVINELKNDRYKKTIQTITYMPHFLSWIIISGLFIQIFSPSTGPLNIIIRALGFEPIYFLGNPDYFRTSMVITGVWKSIGWDSIIYLAALSSIDIQLYESAVIDGCTRLKRIWHITLPGIKPVIILLLILQSGRLIEDNFEQIFNFLNDNVLSVGDVLSTFVYRTGITRMRYSYSVAVDLFTTVIAFILVMTSNFIAKRAGEQGVW